MNPKHFYQPIDGVVVDLPRLARTMVFWPWSSISFSEIVMVVMMVMVMMIIIIIITIMDWFGDDEYFNHKIKSPNQSLPTKTIGNDVLRPNIVVHTVGIYSVVRISLGQEIRKK